MTERAPDLVEAQRFLDALEPNGQFTFQTFADDKSAAGDVKLHCTRVLHGRLPEHAAQLKALQDRGAGVYVTVNATNLRGRRAEDVERVRALSVDLDGAPLAPVLEFELRPHVVVESSPDRWHAYWLVSDIPLAQFSSIQKALIRRFGSDPAVNDLPRVMRVPGFWHLKGVPFQSHLIEVRDDPPFSLGQFRRVLGDMAASHPQSQEPIDKWPSDFAARATAARLATTAAAHSHDHPKKGRQAILLQLGFDFCRAQVPRWIAEEELAKAADLFRSTDSDGKPKPLRPADYLGPLKNAYEHPERMMRAAPRNAPRHIELNDWTAARYSGEAPKRQWLVKDIFPAGTVSLIAAMGGIGKSMMLLELAMRVAGAGAPFGAPEQDFLGANVELQGTAVVLTAEDDAGEIHRRLSAMEKSLSPIPDRTKLIVVALPDAGGAMPLFTDSRDGPQLSPEYHMLSEQLLAIKDLRLLVIDPLQAFVATDLNGDAAAAQFMASGLGRIAAETGAAVIVAHHMRKTDKVDDPAKARDAVRGSTAIVDGVRAVFALWPIDDDEARKHCEALNREYKPNALILGAVVKANGPADLRIRTLWRNAGGQLEDVTQKLAAERPADKDLLDGFPKLLGAAAENGQPYTKTGRSGVYDRRHELSKPYSRVGRNRLEALVQRLLDRGVIVAVPAKKGGQTRWLDLPDGPFARGDAQFVAGVMRKRAKRD